MGMGCSNLATTVWWLAETRSGKGLCKACLSLGLPRWGAHVGELLYRTILLSQTAAIFMSSTVLVRKRFQMALLTVDIPSQEEGVRRDMGPLVSSNSFQPVA